MMGKELVGLRPGALLRLLVLVGDRPLLPVFMNIRLQLVVWQLMLWELRLPGLARAHLLVLVLVGANMWLAVGPLVVLMHLLAPG
jgi:hypothetical protein